MTPDKASTAGVILAGGLARRMGGGHKMLQSVGGETVLRRLINRMRPQVTALALNVNADPERFAGFGLPIVPDDLPGHPGPLAGVLAALDWAQRQGADWVVTLPGDAPFVPTDLVARLRRGLRDAQAQLACAASAGRTHPVIGLWPATLRDDLRRAVAEDDIRKIDRFTGGYKIATVEWSTDPLDPFFNVNTPEDLAEAERLVTAQAASSQIYINGRRVEV